MNKTAVYLLRGHAVTAIWIAARSVWTLDGIFSHTSLLGSEIFGDKNSSRLIAFITEVKITKKSMKYQSGLDRYNLIQICVDGIFIFRW
jgi:hypothetical protein